MKKYTLAKPQGPEPHQSRETIALFRKDGTPVDLGSLFESDGDLSLSMLATDQVIGWDGIPSRISVDEYGPVVKDEAFPNSLAALSGNGVYLRSDDWADYIGWYADGDGKVSQYFGDDTVLDSFPMADWGNPNLWVNGDFNAMGWVGAVAPPGDPLTASGSSAYLTSDGGFYSYLPPTGDPIVMRVKRTSEPLEAPFLMKAEGKMEWREPGDAVGSLARAVLKRRPSAWGDGLLLSRGTFAAISVEAGPGSVVDASGAYNQLASDGSLGSSAEDDASYAWLYPDGRADFIGVDGGGGTLVPLAGGGLLANPRVHVRGTVASEFDDTYIHAGEGFGAERYGDSGLTDWRGGAYLGSDGLLNIFKPPASGNQVVSARANSDAYPRVRLDWDALLFGTGVASPDVALRRVDDGGGFFWMKSDSFAVSANDPVATGYSEPTAWMAGEGHFSATPETLSDAVFQGGPPTDSWWHLKILASGEFQWDVTGGGPDARLAPKTTGGLDLIGGPLDIAGAGVGLIAHSPDGTEYRLAPPNGGGAATWVAV